MTDWRRALWPAAWDYRRFGAGYVLLPGRGYPRLLVPARPGRAAGAVVAAFSAHRTVGLVFGSGAAPLLPAWRIRPRADPLVDLLGSVVGTPVTIGVHLGPSRANRKPVVAAVCDGRPVAFAKVAVDALTSRLIAHEARALRLLGSRPLQAVVPPELLHAGESTLILRALPAAGAAQPTTARRLAAMAEIACCQGESTVEFTADALAAQLAGQPELSAALDRLRHRRLRVGSWHGDWTRWNMAAAGDQVLVWDWERFESGVPIGFDPLHFWFQSELHSRPPTPNAVVSLLEAAPEILRPWGLTDDAATIAGLYLLTLAERYRRDEQPGAIGDPNRWLIPALARIK